MKPKTNKAVMLIVCFAALIAGSIICSVVGFAADFFTIRVEYRFSDGSSAHDPYVAVLPKESEVDLTVKNPIILAISRLIRLSPTRMKQHRQS